MAHQLGKLVRVHPIAPAYVQRAVFITFLAFAFFVGMMLMYYLRANLVFFVLASGFLVVYLFMMFSLIMLRRSSAEIHEHGFRCKKQSILWADIDGVADDGTVKLRSGKIIKLPQSLVNFDRVIENLRAGLDRRST
ncbi:MAG: hypothetical protein AB7J13_02430 [Pyrinomonadaceae bacterium]